MPKTYEVRLKLKDSLTEAKKLAKKDPDQYEVGGIGWVKVTYSRDKSPPRGLMERWIDESFRLLAPKAVVTELPKSGATKKR